jgi:flap endonuclease-1
VYAVASEDMDSLTFGAPRFVRHLMDPSSKKIPVMEFEVAKVSSVVFVLKFVLISYTLTPNFILQILEELEFTMDQFIDLCILCGCDYCDNIKGITADSFSLVDVVRFPQVM